MDLSKTWNSGPPCSRYLGKVSVGLSSTHFFARSESRHTSFCSARVSATRLLAATANVCRAIKCVYPEQRKLTLVGFLILYHTRYPNLSGQSGLYVKACHSQQTQGAGSVLVLLNSPRSGNLGVRLPMLPPAIVLSSCFFFFFLINQCERSVPLNTCGS